MENALPFQAETTLDHESVYLASLILRDVHETIRYIHIIVALLLRFVDMGTAIADVLIRLSAPVVPEGNGS